jgi:acylphosphatase
MAIEDPAELAPRARLDAVVRGRVQNVGFRYFVLRRALDLDLTGWVANAADGSVHCVAEGSRDMLEALAEAIANGPAGALVDRVICTWGPATDAFTSFEIRAGAHRGD